MGFGWYEQPHDVSALTEVKMLKYNRIVKRDHSRAGGGLLQPAIHPLAIKPSGRAANHLRNHELATSLCSVYKFILGKVTAVFDKQKLESGRPQSDSIF